MIELYKMKLAGLEQGQDGAIKMHVLVVQICLEMNWGCLVKAL